jgi:polar amino acid transport system permease protein
VAAAVIVLVAASLIHSVATNKHIEWHVVGQYLFDHRILSGVVLTIELTVSAMTMGVLLGVLLAVMRLSPNPLVSGASWLYIWFFRATPVLVQLLFWFYLAAIYPSISLGIPFVGVEFVHGSANTVITTYVAALLGLGLNEGAYMAEIVRAGIISVGEGQTDAALSLGMSRLQIMRRIVLPQAMRVIIPPTGNETISMLKTSSLASVITLTELLLAAENIYAVNFKPIQLLIVASIWYAVMTSVLYVGQYYLERYYGRGATRALALTPLQRIRMGLFSIRRREEPLS